MRQTHSTVGLVEVQDPLPPRTHRTAPLDPLCQRFRIAYGQSHLRRSLLAQLPKTDALATAFCQRFHALIPPVPQKGFDVAIDTHGACYYGRPVPANCSAGVETPPPTRSARVTAASKARTPS